MNKNIDSFTKKINNECLNLSQDSIKSDFIEKKTQSQNSDESFGNYPECSSFTSVYNDFYKENRSA